MSDPNTPEAEEAGPSQPIPQLRPCSWLPRGPGPLLVCVLDGWGEGKYDDEYNAIARAHTPVMDALKATQATGRWRLLRAHGTAVGLPSNADMGNSEVGHNALGAGQIVDQGAKCVDAALASGAVFSGDGWKYLEPAITGGGTLHFLGLLSDGGVHSRYDQLLLLIRGAAGRGASRIRLHVLSDGRDVEDGTAVAWLERLIADLDSINAETPGADVRIASGGGRMAVTMDRYESDWKVVERGWKAAVLGEAPHFFTKENLVAGVRGLQTGNSGELISDQYLPPWVVVESEKSSGSGSGGVSSESEAPKPVGQILDGDAVVTFNFRADRMVEIAQALEYPKDQFEDVFHSTNGARFFDRKRVPSIKYAGIMQYDGELGLPKHFLVSPPLIERASEQLLMATRHPPTRVFACSESQKIGHVTFFWNGNRSGYIDPALEKFLEIPSDRGISFDTAPAMKAPEIAAATADALTSGRFDFVRCNFANADMVGHTGDLKAAMQACEVVDAALGRLLEAVDSVGGRFLVTADHGNAEDMAQRDKNGAPIEGKGGNVVPLTSHTLNPVPCAIGGAGLPEGVRFKAPGPRGAGLANVTATFLNLLGFEAPDFYEETLIEAGEGGTPSGEAAAA